MRVSRLFAGLVLLFPLLSAASFAAAEPLPAMLPQEFGGWQITKSAQISKNPAAADPTNADVLKEYGFTDYERAVYTRDDGRKLTIKAARFQDTSGAYGACTFYRTPEMQAQKIGDQGYSFNQRVLFFRGNILIDAVFEHLSEMSAAELRELSDDLPRPANGGGMPGLIAYLPKESAVPDTDRYIEGPAALATANSPLPALYVDFSKRAEVLLQDYRVSDTPAKLMLIGYPTPQIAAEQMQQMESAAASHQLQASPLHLRVRRTGPILALVSGSDRDARSLLSSVNYDADVTWNERAPNRRDNVANLIVGVILLAAIIGAISVAAGFAYGGFRLAVKRFFPDRVFDRPEQIEIIALHLSDPAPKPPDSP